MGYRRSQAPRLERLYAIVGMSPHLGRVRPLFHPQTFGGCASLSAVLTILAETANGGNPSGLQIPLCTPHATATLGRSGPAHSALGRGDTVFSARIDTQTRTLLRFVNDLMNVSISPRSHGNRFKHLNPSSKNDMLSHVVPAAPLYVRGHSGRLRQVVSNLVENAAVHEAARQDHGHTRGARRPKPC